MRLMHNLASLNVYREQNKVLSKQSQALGRISSGYKANSAKENPNAIAQSERFRMQIRGVQMAARNVQDGVSMLQTTEGGLDSMTGMLQRVRELVVQSGSGTNSSDDKANVQKEISQLMQEIDRTARSTEYNGVKLLYNDDLTDNAKPGSLFMTSGANAGEKIEIPYFNLAINSGTVKMSDGSVRDFSKLDISAGTSIDDALGMLDSAINTVTSVRSQYGVIENRFESSYASLNEIGDKIEGADSKIRDADIAEEMMEYSKDNILVEAGNAMLVQSNRLPQDVLKILENMRR